MRVGESKQSMKETYQFNYARDTLYKMDHNLQSCGLKQKSLDIVERRGNHSLRSMDKKLPRNTLKICQHR